MESTLPLSYSLLTAVNGSTSYWVVDLLVDSVLAEQWWLLSESSVPIVSAPEASVDGVHPRSHEGRVWRPERRVPGGGGHSAGGHPLRVPQVHRRARHLQGVEHGVQWAAERQAQAQRGLSPGQAQSVVWEAEADQWLRSRHGYVRHRRHGRGERVE